MPIFFSCVSQHLRAAVRAVIELRTPKSRMAALGTVRPEYSINAHHFNPLPMHHRRDLVRLRFCLPQRLDHVCNRHKCIVLSLAAASPRFQLRHFAQIHVSRHQSRTSAHQCSRLHSPQSPPPHSASPKSRGQANGIPCASQTASGNASTNTSMRVRFGFGAGTGCAFNATSSSATQSFNLTISLQVSMCRCSMI